MEFYQREMTAAAIARWAGVGRAAVSNWRRRYPGFPKPVGGSPGSPTFSRTDVEAWFESTGKGDQLATAGRTGTGTHRVHEVPERDTTDLTSRERLARVMVSLLPPLGAAPDAELPVVLDPACAEGTVLMAVADRFGDRVRLVGLEKDASAAAIAELNLSGVPHEIRVGDAPGPRLAAAVVCAPPLDEAPDTGAELVTDPRWEFGVPAGRETDLAWVQHCYAFLRPRGVAVVAVTTRTCVQASGQQVRAGLVRSGALRTVIALPKGLGSVPDTDLCLWVLQRPHHAPEHATVHMIDLTGMGDPGDVPTDGSAWRHLLDDATTTRAVPRLDLLDGDTVLLPARHVSPCAAADAGDLARVTDRLQDLYAQVGRGLPRFAAPASPVHHTSVTLAELERAGALAIRSRDTTPRAGDVLLRTHGHPPAVATGTETGTAGIAQVVEVDPTRLDAQFVATFLRRDAEAVPTVNTLGTLSRDDLRRCRIPRLPLAEQQRYGDAFRRLHELRGVLSALAAASATVIDQTVHGLTTGAVAPEKIRSTYPEGETRQL